jgi:hypothetical protein
LPDFIAGMLRTKRLNNEIAKAAALTVLYSIALQQLLNSPRESPTWTRYLDTSGRARWLGEARIAVLMPPVAVIETGATRWM